VPVVTNLNHNASTPYPFALTKPGLTLSGPETYSFTGWFDGENVGELSNDSLYIVQPLQERYGLDDGSAERAYGVSQGNAPQLAQKFHFLQADSLRGVDLSFVPAGFDWTGMTFQLGVWAVDTAGLPGEVLYLSDSAYSPALPYAGDPFRHYVLDTSGLYVPKDVYIGFIQTTGPAITLGLDLSVNTVKAYGDYAGWYPSLLPGTLMMRPFFRGLPADLSAAHEPHTAGILLYPNPASAYLQGTALEGQATVFNLYGQKMATLDARAAWHLDVSSWPSGLYVLQSDQGERQTFNVQH